MTARRATTIETAIPGGEPFDDEREQWLLARRRQVFAARRQREADRRSPDRRDDARWIRAWWAAVNPRPRTH